MKSLNSIIREIIARIIGYEVYTITKGGAVWKRYCVSRAEAVAMVRLHSKVRVSSHIVRRGREVAAAW